MDSRNRDERGETLAIFRSQGSQQEPFTTDEVADALDCSRQAAADHLAQLVDDGVLETKEIGEQNRVWWEPAREGSTDVPDRETNRETAERRGDTEDSGVVIVDEAGDIAWIDGTTAALFDIRLENAVGQDRDEFMRAILTDRTDAAIVNIIETASDDDATSVDALEFELRQGADEPTVRLEYESEPIGSGRYAGGRVEFFTDVTDQTQPASTRNGENELDVVERASNAFYGLDENGNFTYVNDRAEEVLGRSRSELLGTNIWDEFEEAAGSTFHEKCHEAMETQESVHFEEYYPPVEAWVEVDAYPSESGLSVYFRDVTERREREWELERYKRIVDNVPVGVYRNTPGPDGTFVEGNAELAAIFDADSIEELIGTPVSDLYPDPDRRAEFSRRLERDGLVEDVELKQETLDGRPIWISVTAMKTEEDGEVYFDGIVQDVTERKRREQARKQYETVAESASDAVITIDAMSTIRDVNPAVEDIFGYEPSELTGQPLTVLMPDDLANEYLESIRRYLDTGERQLDWEYIELPGLRKDGTEITIAVSFSEYEHTGERFFTGIVRDISQRKERERELEQYETLFEQSEDVNAVIDPNGTITYVTPSARHILGYEADELVGEDVFEYIHPDDRERMDEYADVVDDRDSNPMVEFRFEHADGSWIVLEAMGRNLLDDESINGLVAYTRDVTERKERERYQRELYEITASNDLTFEEKLDQVFELGRDRFDMELGGLARVDPERDLFEVERVSGHHEHLVPGARVALSETYCRVFTDEATITGISDPEGDGFDGTKAYEEFGVESYLGTKIEFDGDLDRTLFFASTEPREEPFSEVERGFHDLVGQWVSYELERERHERYQQDLYEITARNHVPFEEKIDEMIDLGRERFGLDIGLLTRDDGEALRLMCANGPVDVEEGVTTVSPNDGHYCRQSIGADGPVGVEDIVAEGWEDDPLYQGLGLSCYLGVEVTVGNDHYGTLCFADREARSQSFTPAQHTFLDLMGQWVNYELERELFEGTLQTLNESSRELIRSESKTEVSETVVEAATSTLDLPGVVVYRYDRDADALTVDEQSVDAGLMGDTERELPVDHASLVGHAFCDGEANYYDDVRDAEHLRADPEAVDVRGGSFVPLGTHGVLVVGWRDTGAPNDRTRQLIEILAANAQAAYTRVERERELEEAERRYRTLAENFPDGAVGVYDQDLRYTLVEGAIWDELDGEADQLEGEYVGDVFSEEVSPEVESLYREALDGRAGNMEAEFRGRTFRIWALPMRDDEGSVFGGLGFAIDVTDRVERERKLEEAERRYRTLAENFPNGAVGMFDDDLRYELVEGAIWDDIELSAQDLEGKAIHDAFSEDVANDIEPVFRAAVENGETDSVLTEFSGRILRVWATPVTDSNGEIFAGLSFAQDVTEQIERERALEESRQQYSSIVEHFPNGAIALVDEDLRYATVGGSPRDLTDMPADKIEGEPVDEVLEPELATELVPRYRRALEGETSQFEQEIGDRIYEFQVIPVRDDSGEVFAATGMSQDVTTQVTHQRELEAKARQQEVIADLGHRALSTDDLDDLFDDAVELVAETLDTDYCKVLDLDTDTEELRLRSGVGWKEGHVGTTTIPIDRGSQAGYALLADEPVVVEEREAEERFTGPDLLIDHAVESGVSVVIGSPEEPWGVLGTYDTDSREFSTDEALFVQSVANILVTAIDRQHNEVELEDQRRRLAALNNINGVVREINEALVEQSTREEVERAVCERLADSDSYRFAWIAEVDSRTGSLDPHIEAGVDGYLDAAGVRIDESLPEGQGPVGRAARSKETHVTNDAFTDPTFEPWRDAAREYGYRSCAAIPIVYKDTLYGILGIYTDRVGAFADEERDVVAQLGEIIGHAIASIERKQALMSDDVVEIAIRMENVLGEIGYSGAMDGQIEFDDVVLVEEGTFLQYGRATDGALETVESLVDRLSHWEEVTILSEEFGDARFELRLSEPPVISAVADSGGYIDEAVIEDGTMHMSIHLPPTVDVRRVVTTIQEAYPTAEMMARQQVSRADSRPGIVETMTEELTDRQRAALEASFHAGFFDWPRESSGEEVAESLGVSAPTFHQHLRKAQQKLLDTILS